MKLRPLKEKDIEGILEWMKDPEINCYFRFNPDRITLKSVTEFIDNSMTEKAKHFAVTDVNDNYLGTISLKNINFNDRNSEYAVSFRKSAIGTGVAAFATKEILRIAFNKLNLNKVYLYVLADNERAIKFYNKMGFVYEGKFKEHINIKGNFRDIIWYGIRRSQYEKY